MKYLIIIILGISFTSCGTYHRVVTPDHVGISPSVEWEIEHGRNTKTKPKIEGSLQWNL